MAREDLQAALADLVAGTAPTAAPARPRATGGVTLLDDEDLRLPPIRRSAKPAGSVAEALVSNGARELAVAWYVVRETVAVAALFWLAVIVLSFALQVEALTVPLLVAVGGRATWLLASHAVVTPGRA